MIRLESPKDLEKLRMWAISQRPSERKCVTICSGTGCRAQGAEDVANALDSEIKKQHLEGEVDVRRSGCHGFCERGPLVVVYPEGICYLGVKVKDVPEIVSKTLKNDKLVDRLLYVNKNGNHISHENDIPFYKNQKRIIFANNPLIDPKKIEDYIGLGGYSALSKVLSGMKPEDVIKEIKEANLRGRGGAGFPTGKKWKIVQNVPEKTKYVIVNCDEGDPGAYMDRSLLEGNPHSVLEGLIIGAYAMGAHEGYVYVRQEYPIATENLGIALKQAEEFGLLGENILGSGFDFRVSIHRGAGGFVCGEETALIASLMGMPAEARQRPPYPAQKGLWDRPTCINNVETWANVPFIINNGPEQFKSLGTERSKGTKIFSLVGKVNNTGLVEVPMGMTLREIIFGIGGGIPDGKKFKAVQTGGPSGGVIPESLLDTPVDFEALTEVGSMMGSGGMIVMDENTCMVDIARYYIDFLSKESCGKCVPCREGLRHMLRILNDITSGNGTEEDIESLEDLAEVVQEASLCGLGQTAPNPVLSTLRYFRDEYYAHVKEKRCPAKVCKSLISYYIDTDNCTGCGLCAENCPVKAVDGEVGSPYTVNQQKCTRCGACLEVCPVGAVTKISGKEVPLSSKRTSGGD